MGSELKDNKNIILNTPLGQGQSYGIANVGVKNLQFLNLQTF